MTKVGAIILAAGMSTRMGQPKQWLLLHGKPLFRYSVETAVRNGLHPIYLIGGAQVEQLRANVLALPVTVLDNPNYTQGMSSSLKVGISAIHGLSPAAFIFLADVPFVPDTVIQQMLAVYQSSHVTSLHPCIIRPRYAGALGHPVLLSADLFPELVHLEGDEGARHIIKQHAKRVKFIDFEDPIWGFDVDTPEDWQRIRKVASTQSLKTTKNQRSSIVGDL